MKTVVLGAALIAMATANGVGGQSAQGDIDSRNRAVWVGNASQKVVNADKWEYIDYLRGIVDLHRKYPAEPLLVSKVDALKWRGHADADHRRHRLDVYRVPDVERADRIYEALREAGPAPAIVSDYLRGLLKEETKGKELQAFVSENQARYQLYRKNASHLRETLEQIYDLAQTRPDLKDMVDEVYGRFFAANIDDDARRILDRNPELLSNPYLAGLFDQRGSLGSDVSTLKAAILTGLNQQNKAFEQLRKDVGNAAKRRTERELRQASDVELMLQHLRSQADAARRAAVAKAEEDALQSATFILATLIPDRRTSASLTTAVSAVVDVNRSLRDYERNLELLADQETWGEIMSTTILTGNLLSVGLQLLGLGPARPPIEQVILDEVQQLAKNVAALQIEMHDRFDRVDAGLNLIYRDMSHSFNMISASLANVMADLEGQRRSLNVVATKLDLFERRVIARLDFLIDQPFRNRLAACLGYAERHGKSMSEQEYSGCIGAIAAYLQDAKTSLLSGEWKATYTRPADFAKVLKGEDWGSTINFIRGMARDRAGYAFDGARANPTRWAIAAAAYISLAAENGGHFAGQPLVFLDELANEGNGIAKDFGQELTRGNPDKFIALYRSALEDYMNALEGVAEAAFAARSAALKAAGASMIDFDWSRQSHSLVFSQEDIVRAPVDMFQRPVIKHISPTDPGFEQVPSGNGISATGDATFPDLSAVWSMAVWDNLIEANRIVRTDRRALAEMEAWGPSSLEMGYQALWRRPRYHNIGRDLLFAYGVAGANYFLYMVDGRGNRTLVASASESEQFESIFQAYATGGSIYKNIGIAGSASDLRSLISTMGRPPGGIPNFGVRIDLTTLSQRKDAVRSAVRRHLETELASPVSNLSAAFDELDASVRVLRALALFAYPQRLHKSDRLRQLLFGSIPRLADRALVESPRHSVVPLLTKEIAKQLVQDITTTSEVVLPPHWPLDGAKPAILPTGRWAHSIFLMDYEPFAAAAELLATEFELALHNTETTPEVDPMMAVHLGQLQTLRHIHHADSKRGNVEDLRSGAPKRFERERSR